MYSSLVLDLLGSSKKSSLKLNAEDSKSLRAFIALVSTPELILASEGVRIFESDFSFPWNTFPSFFPQILPQMYGDSELQQSLLFLITAPDTPPLALLALAGRLCWFPNVVSSPSSSFSFSSSVPVEAPSALTSFPIDIPIQGDLTLTTPLIVFCAYSPSLVAAPD
jgi:hypothetical protein